MQLKINPQFNLMLDFIVRLAHLDHKKHQMESLTFDSSYGMYAQSVLNNILNASKADHISMSHSQSSSYNVTNIYSLIIVQKRTP